jgi:hypothetical protein
MTIDLFKSVGAAFSAAIFLTACGGGGSGNGLQEQTAGSVHMVEPVLETAFLAMAKSAACATRNNQLFAIDEKQVLWTRAGTCPDNASATVLYGASTDVVLCETHDSIAGPVVSCKDENYRSLFQTISANLDKSDLGLGGAHTVRNFYSVRADVGTPVDFTVLESGPVSGIITEQTTVVRDAAAFATLWQTHQKSHPDLRMPTIDFTTQMVIGVFKGWDKYGAPGKVIKNNFHSAGKITVEYAFPAAAPSNDPEIAIVGAPYELVTMNLSEDPVEFVQLSTAAANAVNFTTIEKSQFSGINVERTEVIRDAAAWEQLWKQHQARVTPGAPPPIVDFSKNMVVAVFNGERAHTGFTMAITKVYKSGAKLFVEYDSKGPLPSQAKISNYAAVITSLAQMIVLPRSDEPASFIKHVE